MKFKEFFKQDSLKALLGHAGLAVFIMLMVGACVFYAYLPNTTNHGESITVPDLTGRKFSELEQFLNEHELRFAVEDSVYHEEYPPFAVLRQFPKAGAKVKQNRIIYVSINPVMPPMVPMPDLANPGNTTSRVGAEAILRSTGLKRGRVTSRAHADLNLVLEMRYKGKKIEAGTKIPKGSIIDLVVGDGNGTSDFVISSLVMDRLPLALLKLQGWNLRLGGIVPLAGTDTTGTDVIVYKQNPPAGDSVRVGDPIILYTCPRNQIPEEEMEEPEGEEDPAENNL